MKPHAQYYEDWDIVGQISQGNPGAVRICAELIKTGRRDIVDKLYDSNIVGSKIWLAYKDLGDQTLEKLIFNVEQTDLVKRLADLGY